MMPEKVLDGMKAAPHWDGWPSRLTSPTPSLLASDEASFISGTVLRVDGGIVVGTQRVRAP